MLHLKQSTITEETSTNQDFRLLSKDHTQPDKEHIGKIKVADLHISAN